MAPYRSLVRSAVLVSLLALAWQVNAQPVEPEHLGALPDRVAETGLTQGMWLWSDTVYSTAAQRTKLLDFCVQYQFNQLALAVYFDSPSSMQLRHETGLAQLLTAAHARGITVQALRGAKMMAFRKNHDRSLRELDALLAFNARQPEGSRLDGIHYDIEPYGTPEWRAGGDSRRQVQIDYLDFLVAARQRIDSVTDVELCVDIPYWFDKGEFVIEYGGQRLLFSEHIQHATDSVTLMSYHRDPVRVLEQVAGEADYAHKIGRRVHAGMEVGPVRGQEHFISFQWVPTWRFWDARAQIEADARQRRGLDGVFVHYYRALYEKLNGDPPWQK